MLFHRYISACRAAWWHAVAGLILMVPGQQVVAGGAWPCFCIGPCNSAKLFTVCVTRMCTDCNTGQQNNVPVGVAGCEDRPFVELHLNMQSVNVSLHFHLPFFMWFCMQYDEKCKLWLLFALHWRILLTFLGNVKTLNGKGKVMLWARARCRAVMRQILKTRLMQQSWFSKTEMSLYSGWKGEKLPGKIFFLLLGKE